MPYDPYNETAYPTQSLSRRVIFIGVHNKPGKLPLCPSTRTGKVIQKIQSQLPNEIKVIRTNLYNLDYLPPKNERSPEGASWEIWDHYNLSNDDVVVLLGGIVRKEFVKDMGKIIELNHPSFPKSKEKVQAYIDNAVKLIKEQL